jgi:RES domain-containing protein
MVVYRLGKTKYAADLIGEGSRKMGGRWNEPGFACLYTSASRALAILEYTVNTNIHDIPRALSMICIDLGNMDILELTEAELPGDWKKFPAPASTKRFGSSLLKAAKKAIIKIPSVVVPEEYNYLLNPVHIDHKKFKILEVKDFIYDLRIKAN